MPYLPCLCSSQILIKKKKRKILLNQNLKYPAYKEPNHLIISCFTQCVQLVSYNVEWAMCYTFWGMVIKCNIINTVLTKPINMWTVFHIILEYSGIPQWMWKIFKFQNKWLKRSMQIKLSLLCIWNDVLRTSDVCPIQVSYHHVYHITFTSFCFTFHMLKKKKGQMKK